MTRLEELKRIVELKAQALRLAIDATQEAKGRQFKAWEEWDDALKAVCDEILNGGMAKAPTYRFIEPN